MTKIVPNLKEEKVLWEAGYRLIAGVDESGCGPWAGPVVAAAVILPKEKRINRIKDCKLLNAKLREELYDRIINEALSTGLGFVDVLEIDTIGIRKSSIKAMERALKNLKLNPNFVLVDAFKLNITLPQKPIIKGDTTCLSIAAASIVAKVERDRLMLSLHKNYPVYGFDKHKGYGTKLHQAMLKKHGPSEAHRKSFKPIAELIK
jgi:ribonuclease HII